MDMTKARCVATFAPLLHVFTHLKLTMHAYRFQIDIADGEDLKQECSGLPKRRWVSSEEMDSETLSTGMRKCWELIAKDT